MGTGQLGSRWTGSRLHRGLVLLGKTTEEEMVEEKWPLPSPRWPPWLSGCRGHDQPEDKQGGRAHRGQHHRLACGKKNISRAAVEGCQGGCHLRGNRGKGLQEDRAGAEAVLCGVGGVWSGLEMD